MKQIKGVRVLVLMPINQWRDEGDNMLSPVQDAVMAFLNDEQTDDSRSVPEISQAIGRNRAATWSAVSALLNKGLITRAGRGQYLAVTGHRPDPALEPSEKLPDTIKFNVLAVTSDGRLLLEFKATHDVFVAKRVELPL